MQFRQLENDIFLGDFPCSLAEFLVQAPGYEGLPPGMASRIYTPGVSHTLHSSDSQFPGPMPWPAGDEYLAAATQIEAAIVATRPAVNPGTPPVQDRALVTPYEFMTNILKPGEVMAMLGAATPGSDVDYVKTLFLAPSVIDRRLDTYSAGLHVLLSHGLLTQERVDEMLNY